VEKIPLMKEREKKRKTKLTCRKQAKMKSEKHSQSDLKENKLIAQFAMKK